MFSATSIIKAISTARILKTLMKKKLQSILACPLCKGPMVYKSRQKELVCEKDRLAYPVRNGIAVLLNSDARKLNQDEN